MNNRTRNAISNALNSALRIESSTYGWPAAASHRSAMFRVLNHGAPIAAHVHALSSYRWHTTACGQSAAKSQ